MGCTGSKADAARAEWEELVGKNTVAKVLDQQWKSFNSGTRGTIIQWATDAEGAVSSQSVSEIEAHFRKFVDLEASEKGGIVEIFKFENSIGEPDAAAAQAAENQFEVEAAAVDDALAAKGEGAAALEKKVADGTATEDEKKEVELEHKKEELEKKIEAGEKTPAAFRAFLQNGVWAHKPASMGLNQTGGRTFGGGWKRRYLNLVEGQDVMSYSEGPGKPSKGTITFKEMRSIELLDVNEGKQAKAPANVVNFCFVIKTADARYNFGCEAAEDANLTVEAVKSFIPKADGEEAVPVSKDGLVKVAVSIKPKSGDEKIFFHQLQYHVAEEKKEEEVKADEEQKEGEGEKEEEKKQDSESDKKDEAKTE